MRSAKCEIPATEGRRAVGRRRLIRIVLTPDQTPNHETSHFAFRTSHASAASI